MISPKPTITFSALTVELEKNYGCTAKQLPGEETPPVWEIQREVKGKLLYYVLAIEDTEWPLEASVIRSICRRLEIEPPPSWTSWF